MVIYVCVLDRFVNMYVYILHLCLCRYYAYPYLWSMIYLYVSRYVCDLSVGSSVRRLYVCTKCTNVCLVSVMLSERDGEGEIGMFHYSICQWFKLSARSALESVSLFWIILAGNLRSWWLITSLSQPPWSLHWFSFCCLAASQIQCHFPPSSGTKPQIAGDKISTKKTNCHEGVPSPTTPKLCPGTIGAPVGCMAGSREPKDGAKEESGGLAHQEIPRAQPPSR